MKKTLEILEMAGAVLAAGLLLYYVSQNISWSSHELEDNQQEAQKIAKLRWIPVHIEPKLDPSGDMQLILSPVGGDGAQIMICVRKSHKYYESFAKLVLFRPFALAYDPNGWDDKAPITLLSRYLRPADDQ